MAKSLTEWLGKFVEEELEAVLAWETVATRARHVKREASRFEDDGCNFRSTVESPPLTSEHKLQLLQVLDLRSPAAVLVSDGYHSIKAQLSREAQDALQAEIGEELDLEMKGDVFSPSSVTVVSTPFGALIGHLQLYIGGVQYHYHLRKPWGSPKPIHEHEPLAHLLKRTKTIRDKQYAQEVDDDDDDDDEVDDEVESEQPSQAARTQANVTPSLNQRIATQAHIRRKPVGPRLDDDGLEIEKGDNLAMPVAAPVVLPGSKRKQATVSTTDGAALLNLFGAKEVVPEKAPIAVSREAPPSAQPDTIATKQVAQEPASTPAKAPSPDTSAAQIVQHTVPRSSKTSSQGRVPYGRRPIPSNQQRLFEGKDSWFPALPGRIHPHPNVPMDLLTAWNARAADEHNAMAQATQSGAQQGLTAFSRPAAQRIDDEESSMDISSDEELPESQWPASQTPPKRNDLPPDSTIGSRPSAECTAATPRKLPFRSPEKPHPSSAIATPSQRLRQSDADSRRSSQTPMRYSLPPNPPPGLDRAEATSVQATQCPSSSEMDMEPSVPRPLDDPNSRHRQERSKFMKQAQRQTWLEQNCAYSMANIPYINTLVDAYNAAFNNDDISRADMRALLDTVWPKHGTGSFRSVYIKPKKSSFGRPPATLHSGPGRGLFKQYYDGAGDDPDDEPSAPALDSSHRSQQGDKDDVIDERSSIHYSGSTRQHRQADDLHSSTRQTGSLYRPRYDGSRADDDRRSQARRNEHTRVRMTPHDGANDADDAMTGALAEPEQTVAKTRRPTTMKSNEVVGSNANSFHVSDERDEGQDADADVKANGARKGLMRHSLGKVPAKMSKVDRKAIPAAISAAKQSNGMRESFETIHQAEDVVRTPFQEFMLAYNSVKPGGYFAGPKQKDDGKRKSLGRVDVLTWKF